MLSGAGEPVLSGAGESVPPFPGPDVVVGSHRPGLLWSGVTLLLAAGSVVFAPIILGPLAILAGLVAFSRAERLAVIVLALAVAAMLTGLVLSALVLHHHHHSLISHVRFL